VVIAFYIKLVSVYCYCCCC